MQLFQRISAEPVMTANRCCLSIRAPNALTSSFLLHHIFFLAVLIHPDADTLPILYKVTIPALRTGKVFREALCFSTHTYAVPCQVPVYLSSLNALWEVLIVCVKIICSAYIHEYWKAQYTHNLHLPSIVKCLERYTTTWRVLTCTCFYVTHLCVFWCLYVVI